MPVWPASVAGGNNCKKFVKLALLRFGVFILVGCSDKTSFRVQRQTTETFYAKANNHDSSDCIGLLFDFDLPTRGERAKGNSTISFGL